MKPEERVRISLPLMEFLRFYQSIFNMGIRLNMERVRALVNFSKHLLQIRIGEEKIPLHPKLKEVLIPPLMVGGVHMLYELESGDPRREGSFFEGVGSSL